MIVRGDKSRLSRQRFARGIRFPPERDSNLLENSMRFPPCIQGAFIYQRRLAVHSDPRVPYPSRDIEAGSPRWIVTRRGRLDICRDGRQQITSQLLVRASTIGVSRAAFDSDSYRGVSIDVHAYRVAAPEVRR